MRQEGIFYYCLRKHIVSKNFIHTNTRFMCYRATKKGLCVSQVTFMNAPITKIFQSEMRPSHKK